MVTPTPSTSTTAAVTNVGNAPNQELVDAEQKLKSLLDKKKERERELQHLEFSLYQYETSYLDDTLQGNIVKGYENYITGRTDKRKNKFTELDRIFSNSSMTFAKSLEARQREETGLFKTEKVRSDDEA
ncbi:histone acetyltransferase subunit NuA4-domain-containing protein [Chytridium lagenaria]|nr:histone acetyltransferase subunit NuA4-domain-containing protein [Chytridium lagenaria]